MGLSLWSIVIKIFWQVSTGPARAGQVEECEWQEIMLVFTLDNDQPRTITSAIIIQLTTPRAASPDVSEDVSSVFLFFLLPLLLIYGVWRQEIIWPLLIICGCGGDLTVCIMGSGDLLASIQMYVLWRNEISWPLMIIHWVWRRSPGLYS